MKLYRLVANRLAVPVQRIEHHAEYTDENGDADPENVGVQADDLHGHRAHRRLEIPLVIRERKTRHGDRQSNGSSKKTRDDAWSGAILHAIPDQNLLAFSRWYRYPIACAPVSRFSSLAMALRSRSGSASPNCHFSVPQHNSSRPGRPNCDSVISARTHGRFHSRRSRVLPLHRSTITRSPDTVNRSHSIARRSM